MLVMAMAISTSTRLYPDEIRFFMRIVSTLPRLHPTARADRDAVLVLGDLPVGLEGDGGRSGAGGKLGVTVGEEDDVDTPVGAAGTRQRRARHRVGERLRGARAVRGEVDDLVQPPRGLGGSGARAGARGPVGGVERLVAEVDVVRARGGAGGVAEH